MEPDRHEAWEAAMARCCDNWRQCFQRALEIADRPIDPPVELCLLQANWLAANAPRPFEFWLRLLDAADEGGERVFACLFAGMQARDGEFARLREQMSAAAASGDAQQQASIAGRLNDAYTRWLKATQARNTVERP